MKKLFSGTLLVFSLTIAAPGSHAASFGWYTEGDFAPGKRIQVTLTNPLGVDRKDCPVVIQRTELPDQNIPELFVTVVDPSLPPNPKDPTIEELKNAGAELLRKETNGHFVEYQLDDLDKDGLWDELFFLTDIKARETKTIFVYVDFTERGLIAHKTHAGMGYYGRHLVPFWEAEYIGWKLWYPTDVDMHGKRKPMLTAYPEYQGNLGGYYMPMEMGTDIMAVGNTFGAGGICLWEHPALSDSISRPRFTPFNDKGPIHETRYGFDLISNGPLRSIIRARTMNWRSGKGEYELEQLYSAIAHKSYSLCTVRFTKFVPGNQNVMFGCGIREIMNQNEVFQKGGLVISMGKDVNPYPPLTQVGSTIVAYREFKVDFEAIAMVVKDSYKPQYRNLKSFSGNHAFRFPV
ncbi:MAG: DUF4861 family protein, partial [Candidatus Latescibacterota bacterium]